MRFFLGDDLLDQAPDTLVVLVVARFPGAPDAAAAAWAAGLLRDAAEAVQTHLGAGAADAAARVREEPRIAAWRDAFARFGINPNRFPSSVEALALRAAKGDGPPAVHPLVDLANAVALRHLVPLGAHDPATIQGDLGVRLSRPGERFGPDPADEAVPPGEPVYADDRMVRTRRWVWRQAPAARITPQTRAVLFPIDGFRGRTDDAVLAAAADLLDLLSTLGPDGLALYRVDGDARAARLVALPAGATDPRGLPLAADLRATFTRMAMTTSTTQAGGREAAEQEQRAMVEPLTAPGPAAGTSTDEAAIREALERSVEIVEVRDDLERALRSGRTLRVKLGIDPTGPRIHIGRAVQLRKMRQFQRLGHQAVLIVGDMTAQLGDASDKNEERPMLTAEQVREHMRNYEQQIGLILDVAATEFQYNGTWLNALSFKDVIALAKHFTAAQMIGRENFRLRWDAGEPIGLHEMLYPLMQGYDSVVVRADVELGGTDQLFNVMAGRKIQEVYGQKPQNVLLTGMVLGLDGRKMSTSWGNAIFIDDAPADQYGKVMSTSDEMILPYLEYCTSIPLPRVRQLGADLAAGHVHPKELKKLLAHEIVGEYHGAAAADFAQHEFERVFEQRGAPSAMPGVVVPAAETRVIDLLLATGQAPSKAHARRVIEQGGVEIDDTRIDDANASVLPREGMVVKFGKRSFVRLQVRQAGP